MITNRALPVLANLCVLTDKFNRQYDKEFGQKGKKIGATCNVRLPPRYLGTFGPGLNVEPSTENYVPVNVLYQFHVDMQFNTVNMLLDIDDFEWRFLHPACVAVANRVDSDGAYFALQNTGNRVGTPGSTPTAFKNFTDARAILVSEGMPKGMMPTAVLHPLAHSSMADSLKGLFNPQAHISDLFETGLVAAKTAGADWFEDPNIANYTTGTFTGTPVLAGTTSGVGGSALITAGWAQTGVLNISGLTNSVGQCQVGDTIQIAGCFPVNPQNRGRYGNALKSFVILPPGGYTQMVGSASPGGPQFAPASLAAGTFNATTGVVVQTCAPGYCTLNPGAGLTATVVSSNLNTGTITTSAVTFAGGSSAPGSTGFLPNDLGQTTLSIIQPAGFTNSTLGASAGIATVIGNPISRPVYGGIITGAGTYTGLQLSLDTTPPVPVTITVSLADPSLGKLSLDPNTMGTGSTLTFPSITKLIYQSSSPAGAIPPIYVQGIAPGYTQLIMSGKGYLPSASTVLVGKVGLTLAAPSNVVNYLVSPISSTSTASAPFGLSVLDPYSQSLIGDCGQYVANISNTLGALCA